MRHIRTFVFISVSFVISLILTSFLFDRAILFVAEDSVTFCYLDIYIGFLTYCYAYKTMSKYEYC